MISRWRRRRTVVGLLCVLVSLVSAAAASAAGPPVFVYTGNGGYSQGFSKFATAAGRDVVETNTFPASLSGNACVVLPIPVFPFDDDQKSAIQSYVSGGGTVIALSEYTSYDDGFPVGSLTGPTNALSEFLGAGITLQEDDNDLTFAQTSNIGSMPLTSGVNLLGYAATASVTTGGTAQVMARTSLNKPFLAGQQIGTGWYVVSGDSNLFSNYSQTWYDPGDVRDNDRLAKNLCGNKPPTVTIASPGPPARYRLGATVAADYACADQDGPADIVTCAGPVADGAPLDTSIAGLRTFTVTAVDSVGNTTPKEVSYIVDGNSPIATPSVPGPGAEYQRNSTQVVSYSCNDLLEGPADVVSCIGPLSVGALLNTSVLGAMPTFTITAIDRVGNTGQAVVNYSIVDKRPPSIAITAPAGPYSTGQNVTVGYTCTDPDDDVATCLGPLASGAKLGTGTAGTYTFTVTATDLVGNAATKTVTYKVVDPPPPVVNKPPAVTINTPKDGATYSAGQKVSPGFVCTDPDGPADIVSCEPEAPINTAAAGTFTFTVIARDKAGATARKSVTYRVTAAAAAAPTTAAAAPKVCKSRRQFRIRVKKLRGGVKAVSATVFVNGKKTVTRKGGRITATVTLKGLKKGTYNVKINVKYSNGRTLSYTRRFRTCVPKST